MKIIIHVGLHKTGTTFLQRVLFRKLKNVEVYGEANKELKDINQLDEDKINLISNEGFSKSMNFKNGHSLRKKTAIQLKKKFPDAKILLVLRNKEEWIRSLHSEYVKVGGYRDFDSWYKYVFNEKLLNFSEYISLLNSLFDEVMIVHYETFKKTPDLFVKKICDFIGVDVPKYENKMLGKRLSKRQMKLFRFMNILFKNKYDNHPAPFPAMLNPLNIYRQIDKLSKREYK